MVAVAARPNLRHVPPRLRPAYLACLENLERGRACTRCHGEGHLDDVERWVLVPKTGRKTCFRCRGTCVEPPRKFVDPMTVRTAVVGRLVPLVEHGEVAKVMKMADEAAARDPYFPIVADAFERALAAAERNARM